MKEEKIEELLAKEGWTVDCWSPFEIRHEDGSFATMQAARVLVSSLTEAVRLEAMHSALTAIGATAHMAQAASKNEFEKSLWEQVAARARSALID